MKKFIFTLLITLFLFPVFAKQSDLQYYKPIYIIGGNADDQVKIQLSFKYSLFDFNKQNSLYFAYSQYMFWDLYKASSPFREINYNPEIFYQITTPISHIDFIQVSPFEHISNGRDKEESRGVNNLYSEIQTSTQTKINIGLCAKIFYSYMRSSKNEDIQRFSGNNSIKLFIQLLGDKKEFYTDKEELYFKISSFAWNKISLCNYEVGLKFRIISDVIAPYFFINFYKGYAESLIDYNKKDTAIRAGILLNY